MDLSDLQVWHYGLIIGGAILVLGLVLYFLGVRKIKVAPVVPAGFAGLAVGLAAGVIWLAGFGYKPVDTGADEPAAEGAAKGDAAPKGGGMPKGGGGKGGGFPKGGAGGGAPPGPRVQLLNLINALDVLVDRPVAVSLTTEDRAAIAAQLRGLDAAAEIKDDEAKAKLDAIQKVLEKDRQALEAVGYRWQGVAPKGVADIPPPMDALMASPNPFKAPQTVTKLKSLRERLTK